MVDHRQMLAHGGVALGGAVRGGAHLPAEQAGPPGLDGPGRWQRAADALGGHFHLINAAVGVEVDRLDAHAAVEVAGLGRAVVENVPLAVEFGDRAVVVPGLRSRSRYCR